MCLVSSNKTLVTMTKLLCDMVSYKFILVDIFNLSAVVDMNSPLNGMISFIIILALLFELYYTFGVVIMFLALIYLGYACFFSSQVNLMFRVQ